MIFLKLLQYIVELSLAIYISFVLPTQLSDNVEDQLSSAESAILGLLIIIIFICIEIALVLYKIKTNSEQDSSNISAINISTGKLLQLIPQEVAGVLKNSPVFEDRLESLGKEAKDVRLGRFTIRAAKPEEIWKRHMHTFDIMYDGKMDFRATCLVPEKPEDIDKVFANEKFNEYCEYSYSKYNNPEIGRMRKVFILPSRGLIDVDSLREHLLNAKAICEKARPIRTSKLPPRTTPSIDFRIIFWDECHFSEKLKSLHTMDYMIWGNEVLAESELQRELLLSGISYSCRKQEITEKISDFNLLFKEGQEINSLFH